VVRLAFSSGEAEELREVEVEETEELRDVEWRWSWARQRSSSVVAQVEAKEEDDWRR
jgi:hypothetical protein